MMPRWPVESPVGQRSGEGRGGVAPVLGRRAEPQRAGQSFIIIWRGPFSQRELACLQDGRASASTSSFRSSPLPLSPPLARSLAISLPRPQSRLQLIAPSCGAWLANLAPSVLYSSLSTPIRLMASSSVMRTAVVVMAVVSSVAVLANAQAPAPAPTSAGFSLVPSLVAPVLGMVVAFFASRVLC